MIRWSGYFYKIEWESHPWKSPLKMAILEVIKRKIPADYSFPGKIVPCFCKSPYCLIYEVTWNLQYCTVQLATEMGDPRVMVLYIKNTRPLTINQS
jgi:hypothetical protein